ncbi:dual specificity tyrosine-phosphorylation-regulated kinase 2-like [Petromyzon marinus]|uniref:dual specificity tyrosine-phosphorylation-regulated kinase 2-like n=1 Tax=Petromyzon marinus TaxID=7757 RepID=UPI003F6FEFC8
MEMSRCTKRKRKCVRWSALSDSKGGASIKCKTPQEIMQLYGSYLTLREQRELLAMQEIWYLGLQNQARGKYNNGYEDDKHCYVPVKQEHLNFRYEVLKTIGEGGQGIVVKCLDHMTNILVAVKIHGTPLSAIDNNFQLREIKIGIILQESDTDDSNIIKMLDWFQFRKHYTIVLELLSGTLDDWIGNRKAKSLRMEMVKIYTKGILTSLRHIHSKTIIHGDLKPENILVKDCVAGTIKVTDFGHSFVEGYQTSLIFGTVKYMSPEGFLGYSSTNSVDMWALGCTVAKIATGKSIFEPINFYDQLVCCMEVLGLPPDYLVNNAPKRNKYFDGMRLVA